MLCSRLLNVKVNKKSNNKFEDLYISFLKFILEKKIILITFIILIIFSIIFIFQKVSKELSPREDRGAFFMLLESPEGSTYQNTVNQMLKIEKKLMKFNENKEAKRILLRVPRSFSGTENFSDGIGIIVLEHWEKRRNIWKIIEEIKKISTEITDSRIIIFPPRGLGQRRSGVSITVRNIRRFI